MGFITNDHLVGAVTVPPSRLKPGDTVADTDRTRAFTISSLEAIKIWYHGHAVPVWLIKGWDGPGRLFEPNVQTVCIPGHPWYLLRRDQ